ncbi:MAG: hypothetical protein HQK54_09240 [Oligoflexales bacterium]|nr:hypothetical protein [Oligoflexales bacterium]
MNFKLVPVFVALAFALPACNSKSGSTFSQVNADNDTNEYIEIESADFMECSKLEMNKSAPGIKIQYNNECYGYLFPQGFFSQDELEKKFLVFVKDSYPEPSVMKLSSSNDEKVQENTVANAYRLIKKSELSYLPDKQLSERSRRAKRRACKAGAVIVATPGYIIDVGVAIGCGLTFGVGAGTFCSGVDDGLGKASYEAVLRSCHI